MLVTEFITHIWCSQYFIHFVWTIFNKELLLLFFFSLYFTKYFQLSAIFNSANSTLSGQLSGGLNEVPYVEIFLYSTNDTEKPNCVFRFISKFAVDTVRKCKYALIFSSLFFSKRSKIFVRILKYHFITYNICNISSFCGERRKENSFLFFF